MRNLSFIIFYDSPLYIIVLLLWRSNYLPEVIPNKQCWLWDIGWIHPRWLHQMETFSKLLALCAGNSPVTSEFPSQRPVMWSFDVSFDLHLNKRLSKQSWGWWFEMPSCSFWHHCSGHVCRWLLMYSLDYRKVSNIRGTLVDNKIVDHSDVVGAAPTSALLQLHLHSQLNTWLQWIGQRQLQDKTRNIYVSGLGASYIRELTVVGFFVVSSTHWILRMPCDIINLSQHWFR